MWLSLVDMLSQAWGMWWLRPGVWCGSGRSNAIAKKTATQQS
jgi:hypothetical protein